MIDDGMREQLRNLDDRLARVEQFLPSVATKDDLKAFATKDDLEAFATKDDLKAFATKDDLRAFATKDDLRAFVTKDEFNATVATLATKEDLRPFPTRDEMLAAIHQSAAMTRDHFDLIAESFRDEIRIALEGHVATTSRVAALETKQQRLESRHDALDRRVTVLEAAGSRRKK